MWLTASGRPVVVALLFCACSRASSPAPASESARGPSPSVGAADTPPPITTTAVSAESPGSPPSALAASATPAPSPSAATVPSASAASTPGASRAPNPWTRADDCSRYESAPEYRGLSPEDRARSRATCETKEEFRAFVATRQACSSASECTIVSGSCPFGCFVPVAKRSSTEVTAKLQALGARLDKAGDRCVYRCMGPPSDACEDGRCVSGPR
jgi:hypothetical protein